MSVILVGTPALPEADSARFGRPISYFETYRLYMTPDQSRSFPMEHLGLMSIKSYAATQGVPVHTVNGLVEEHTSIEQTFAAIRRQAGTHGTPKLVGFSNIATTPEVLSLAERCKRAWPQVQLAMGNTFATLNYERILAEYTDFDYVVVADGEKALTDLARCVLDDVDPRGVAGIAWRSSNGDVMHNPPAMVDLNRLPWPRREELPLVVSAGFAAAVYTSRGCPYRCTFCGTGATSALLGERSYRLRDIADVVDEIEYLTRDFGIDFLVITDDLFLSKHPASRDRAVDFANEIIRRGLDINFMLDCRVDSIDRAVFALLWRAGLRRVFLGLETGSPTQLAAYRKRYGLKNEQPRDRFQILADLGIDIIPGTMTFHPDVTPAELRQTLAVLLETKYECSNMLFDRVTAYPGTPLYAEYKAKGYLSVDWPLGEWKFRDSGAERVHDKIFEFIMANPQIRLSDAAGFFVECIDEWEALARQQSGGSS
jgi:radical SAM superfamily enzyme YgiQ (UPF0313 family)